MCRLGLRIGDRRGYWGADWDTHVAQPSPKQRTSGVSVWLYAGAVLAVDFHLLGGARWRRREVSVRRLRCSRMRSMVFGSVMNETIRISSPHRGQCGS